MRLGAILGNIVSKVKRLANELLVEPPVSIKDLDLEYRKSLTRPEMNAVHVYVGHHVRDNGTLVVSRIACFPVSWGKAPFKMCEALPPKHKDKGVKMSVYMTLNWIEARIAMVNGDPIRIISESHDDFEFYEEEMDRIATFFNKTIAVDVINNKDRRFNIIKEANLIAEQF